MNRDTVLRRTLWAAAIFNLLGALLFAFPASYFGQLAGLPPAVPGAYRAMTALFVLLFGGVYLWLAQQAVIDRPLLMFGAIGKASAFLLVCILWLVGAASGVGVLIASGDLVFAVLFVWSVRGARRMASGRAKATRLRAL
jgi:hypothetical protein